MHVIKNCKDNKKRDSYYRNGYVALIPNNTYTQKLEEFFVNNNYSTKYYDSTNDFYNYIKGDDYNEDICIGVSLDFDESA